MPQTKFGRPLQEMSSGQLIEYAEAITVQYTYHLDYPGQVAGQGQTTPAVMNRNPPPANITAQSEQSPRGWGDRAPGMWQVKADHCPLYDI